MKVEEKQICPRCERIGKLTRDHRVPQVLVRQARRLGIELPEGYSNKELMCAGCNLEKGDSVDLDDPVAVEFLQRIAAELTRRGQRGDPIPLGKLARFVPVMQAACAIPLPALTVPEARYNEEE